MKIWHLGNQTFPPIELVPCPHATVHKLFGFLTLVLHDNVFNNKSFHDVKYISRSWFYLWFVLVWQPWIWQMLVLVLTPFIVFTYFLAAIHNIWKYKYTGNDKPSMYIRNNFLHVMNDAKNRSIFGTKL